MTRKYYGNKDDIRTYLESFCGGFADDYDFDAVIDDIMEYDSEKQAFFDRFDAEDDDYDMDGFLEVLESHEITTARAFIDSVKDGESHTFYDAIAAGLHYERSAACAGYMSRRTDILEQPIEVSRDGELYVEVPSWSSGNYHLRIYLSEEGRKLSSSRDWRGKVNGMYPIDWEHHHEIIERIASQI